MNSESINHRQSNNVFSPFTKKPARLLESIPTDLIIKEYKELVQYDVSEYFSSIKNINIYECSDTKFRFYYPIVEGKPSLYERLSYMHGYYPIWKWENDVAQTYIKANDRVLDIGCGNGEFLKKINKDLHCEVKGLEFNDKALDHCKKNNVLAVKQSIESHSLEYDSYYDVVCTFQVLEHVANPDSFLESAIRALKKGGTLIIGVPNNFPYLFKYGKYHPLNMPPHHCGLWNDISLSNLEKYFNVNIQNIHEEKIKSVYQYFFMPYLYVKFYLNMAKNDQKNYKWLKFIDNKVSRLLVSLFWPNKNRLRGHTIVAVYAKK